MNKPRLTEEERLRSENGLRERRTPCAIAKALGRPVRTIVREIRARRVPCGKGAFGHVTNRCLLRKDCTGLAAPFGPEAARGDAPRGAGPLRPFP